MDCFFWIDRAAESSDFCGANIPRRGVGVEFGVVIGRNHPPITLHINTTQTKLRSGVVRYFCRLFFVRAFPMLDVWGGTYRSQ